MGRVLIKSDCGHSWMSTVEKYQQQPCPAGCGISSARVTFLDPPEGPPKSRDSWNTPTVADTRPGRDPETLETRGHWGADNNTGNLRDDVKRGGHRGVLNSRWVAQLMGYPSDWLDVPTEKLSKLWATRSSARSCTRLGSQSSKPMRNSDDE